MLFRSNELTLPSHGVADGHTVRIGFRPYAVSISPHVNEYRHRAVIKHTFFLGVMLRIEIQTPSGLVIRTRMTKEEYARLNLCDGQEISFLIREYRILARDGEGIAPEVAVSHQARLGEGI